MGKTGASSNMDDKKHGMYRITEVFTNGNVQVQKGATNELINIRLINLTSDEVLIQLSEDQPSKIWGVNFVSDPIPRQSYSFLSCLFQICTKMETLPFPLYICSG